MMLTKLERYVDQLGELHTKLIVLAGSRGSGKTKLLQELGAKLGVQLLNISLELVGRLSAIQDDCAAAEVHRRMSEIYGEREGKRVIRLAPTPIHSDELTVWLIEAAVRYVGKPVSVNSLQSLPVLFPFSLTRPLAYLVSNCQHLDVQSEGPNNQFVALRQR